MTCRTFCIWIRFLSCHSSKEWPSISIADKENLRKQTVEASEFWWVEPAVTLVLSCSGTFHLFNTVHWDLSIKKKKIHHHHLYFLKWYHSICHSSLVRYHPSPPFDLIREKDGKTPGEGCLFHKVFSATRFLFRVPPPGCLSMNSRGTSPSWRCVTWPPMPCRVRRDTAGRCPSTRAGGWEAALLAAAGTSRVGLGFALYRRQCQTHTRHALSLFRLQCANVTLRVSQTRFGQTPSTGCSSMRRMTTQRTDRSPARLSWLWCRKVDGCSATKGPDSSPSAFLSTRSWSRDHGTPQLAFLCCQRADGPFIGVITSSLSPSLGAEGGMPISETDVILMKFGTFPVSACICRVAQQFPVVALEKPRKVAYL